MPNIDSTIVVDVGSKTIKAGFTYNTPGEDDPRVFLPNAVEMDVASTSGRAEPETQVHFPVQAGRIVDFEALEAMLHSLLYTSFGWEFGNEGNVLMTEPILTPRADREHLCHLMFEVFNVGGFFVADQPVCSLYAANRTSGLVVDIGHAKTDVSCVTEGLLNVSTAMRLPYGGELLTHYLDTMLQARGTSLRSLHEVELVKLQASRCAEHEADFEAVLAAATAQAEAEAEADAAAEAGGSGTAAMAVDGVAARAGDPSTPEMFKLPDGQEIYVSRVEGLHLGEALFSPHLLGDVAASFVGLADATATVAAGIDTSLLRKAILDNVVVCGGVATMPGLPARLSNELRCRVSPGTSVSLAPFPDYMPQPHTTRYCSWVGAGVMAKVVNQQVHFVSKQDYEEVGPYAIHRRSSP